MFLNMFQALKGIKGIKIKYQVNIFVVKILDFRIRQRTAQIIADDASVIVKGLHV